MAFKPIFRFRNPDSTLDLNTAYSSAIGRGIYSGGDISISPSNLNISISPFRAVGNDGMTVVSDNTISLTATNGFVNVIALFAKYERPGDPIISLQIHNETAINSSSLKDFFVILGKIDLTAGGYTGITYESTSPPPPGVAVLTYNGANYGTQVGTFGLKKAVAAASSLPVVQNNDGDVRYAIAEKSFYAWDTASKTWVNVLATTATNTTYGGGGNWANGATNPATTVENQLDKIITDLGSGDGSAKIAVPLIAGSPIALVAGTLTTAISTLLDAVNQRGVLNDINTWQEHNTFDDTVTITDKLTITSNGLEVDGLTQLNTGLEVTGNAIIDGQLTVTGNSNLSNISVTGTGTFSGSVTTTQVITSLAPSQLYVDNSSYVTDIVNNTTGGGIGIYSANLQNILQRVNTSLVRKRAFTAVITDGTNSTGGDFDGPNAVDILINGTFSSGNFFLRRGVHTFSTTVLLSINATVIGEHTPDNPVFGAGAGYYSTVTFPNTGDVTISARFNSGSIFESLAFEAPGNRRFILNSPGNIVNIYRQCQFSLGGVQIGQSTRLEDCKLQIDLGSTNSESLLIDSLAGDLDGVYISNLIVADAPAAGAGTLAALRMQANTGDTYISIKNSKFSNSLAGYVLDIQNSTANTVFENCVFSAIGANNTVLNISGSRNITFKNCIFIQQASDGSVLNLQTSSNIIFENCIFRGTTTGATYIQDISVVTENPVANGVSFTTLFDKCDFEIKQPGVSGTSVYKLKLNGPGIHLIDCELILNYGTATYGPMLDCMASIDGLTFNGREYQYDGNAANAPFFFYNNSNESAWSPTIVQNCLFGNMKAPSTSSVNRLIAINSINFIDSELRFGSSSAGNMFALGVIAIGDQSKIKNVHFINTVSPIGRWVYVNGDRVEIDNNYFESTVNPTTISYGAGTEIFISDSDNISIKNNRFEIVGSGISAGDSIINISASLNGYSQIDSNNIDITGALTFVNINAAIYLSIQSNIGTYNTNTNFDFILGFGGAHGGGFIVNNTIHNFGSGIMSITNVTPIVFSPNSLTN